MAAPQVTVYHVNSYALGAIPRDMDVSDLGGDIFFDLHSVVLPIECADFEDDPDPTSQMDCANSEITADDLVISKLRLEVDSRFGEYGRCNVCGADGVDPFSGLNCAPNEYFCSCGGYLPGTASACDSSEVGYENLTETFKPAFCTWDYYVTEPWACWEFNVISLTGGGWYSTPASGYCDDLPDGAPCTWRVVQVEKIIDKACSDESIYAAVEAHDDSGCFDGCDASLPTWGDVGAQDDLRERGNTTHERNTTSPCWIGCFYKTVLGANGMLPASSGGLDANDGMTYDDLVAAWARPFESDDPALYGCPAYTETDAVADISSQMRAALAFAARRTQVLRTSQRRATGES